MTAAASAAGYWDEFLTTPVPVMAAKGYNSLKYLDLPHGNPVAALRVAKWIGTQRYDLVGRNCLDDTYDVLRAYGVPHVPPPSHALLPNVWFDAFLATFAQIQGFLWERTDRPTWRHKVALEMAKAASPKVPTWRRSGHRDARNLQAQIKALESGTRPPGFCQFSKA